MYTKDQLEQQLKNNAKSALFEREFMSAFNKHLTAKKEGVQNRNSERADWQTYALQPSYTEV
jgi:hypothetical protein